MKIPAYPESRTLNMADKPLLDKIFKAMQPLISEMTFAGLYLFRSAHNYHLSMLGDSLVIMGSGYDGTNYCLPPLSGNIKKALATLLKDGHNLYGADQRFVDTYLSGEGVAISEDRDSFDYLYLRNDLALLPGNRFHKKKNRINYFTSRHQHQVAPYSDRFTTGCQELLNSWFLAVQERSNSSLKQEFAVTAEALLEYGKLGLEGIVITVSGTVAAFALGERLNRDTAVCHFEKYDPYIEGLSQLINREFSRLLFSDCNYINREQDLGEAGLRNAKLSYRPVELIKKFRVSCPG